MSTTSVSEFRFSHQWNNGADRAALDLCASELKLIGVDLADARADEAPSAIKMHGMQIVEALASDPDALLDLNASAQSSHWLSLFPSYVRRYTVHGDRWHGIPVGIHRINAMWVNTAVTQPCGAAMPQDLDALLHWLDRVQSVCKSPLAIGAEAWQIGLLFESCVLAGAGPAQYLRAFDGASKSVWLEPSVLKAIECFLTLRRFVSDEHLQLGWSDQLARVANGSAAVFFMGDWTRAVPAHGLTECAVPGTSHVFVADFDFVVPLRGAPSHVASGVARALTNPDFQTRFARLKGCMPAASQSWAGVDASRAQLLASDAAVLPSFALEQCGPSSLRQVFLTTVAEHFVRGDSGQHLSHALADIALHH